MYQLSLQADSHGAECELRQTTEDWPDKEMSCGETPHYLDTVKHFMLRSAYVVSPSFLHHFWSPNQEPILLTGTAYLDGLRGIAASIVFVEHYALPFQSPQMLHGYGEGEHNRNILQLPGIRLFYSGASMVVVFFVISGFVLSLKPLVHIQSQKWDLLLSTVASSLCRRGIRLYLPTLVSTFLVAITVRLYLFNTNFADFTEDFRPLRPLFRDTLWAQLEDWCHFVWADLTDPWAFRPFAPPSNYGGHLWTIRFEFRSSLLLFLAIIALSQTKRLPSLFISVFLILYCMSWQRWDISLFLCGMCLAKLHLYQAETNGNASQSKSLLKYMRPGLSWLALFIGVYFLSYPWVSGAETPGYMWFAAMFPLVHHSLTLGAVLIVGSVGEISSVKYLLLTPVPQYLGRISFALYIVHEPLVQVLGWPLVPLMWHLTGQATRLQYQLGFCLAFLILVPVVVWVADIFWRLVDIQSMAFASRVVARCSIEDKLRWHGVYVTICRVTICWLSEEGPLNFKESIHRLEILCLQKSQTPNFAHLLSELTSPCKD